MLPSHQLLCLFSLPLCVGLLRVALLRNLMHGLKNSPSLLIACLPRHFVILTISRSVVFFSPERLFFMRSLYIRRLLLRHSGPFRTVVSIMVPETLVLRLKWCTAYVGRLKCQVFWEIVGCVCSKLLSALRNLPPVEHGVKVRKGGYPTRLVVDKTCRICRVRYVGDTSCM